VAPRSERSFRQSGALRWSRRRLGQQRDRPGKQGRLRDFQPRPIDLASRNSCHRCHFNYSIFCKPPTLPLGCVCEFDELEKQRKKALTSKDDKFREAAEEWGDRGTDNSINVTFVQQKQMDQDAGNRDPDKYAVSAMVTPKAGSDHKGQINAEFSQVLSGSDLRKTIVHEGSQIKDDFNFLKSYDPVTGKYNAAKNFTIFASESEAYDAGSRVKSYPMFPRGPKGYPKMMEYVKNQYPNADGFQFKPSDYPQ
jgi:hypothetical protein